MRRLLALALAPLLIYLLSAATELVLRVPFPVPDSGGAVVVTGASSGIGLAAALHLSSLGFTVYAGVRSEEAADVVRKASASAGAGLKTLYIDVAHQASVDAAAARVGSELQGHGTKLVGLIANAGGINPLACKAALERVLAKQGIDLKVGVVLGDEILGQTAALRAGGVREMFSGESMPEGLKSANAYLGARPIAALLGEGCDVVLTGRCVDSAVTVPPNESRTRSLLIPRAQPADQETSLRISLQVRLLPQQPEPHDGEEAARLRVGGPPRVHGQGQQGAVRRRLLPGRSVRGRLDGRERHPPAAPPAGQPAVDDARLVPRAAPALPRHGGGARRGWRAADAPVGHVARGCGGGVSSPTGGPALGRPPTARAAARRWRGRAPAGRSIASTRPTCARRGWSWRRACCTTRRARCTRA